TYTAMYPGYGARSKGIYEGTAIDAAGEGYIFRRNRIDYTGWVGLSLSKNGHHLAENNIISHSLAVLNDGGAIFIGSSNNIIRGNFLFDSIGNVGQSNGCFLGNNPCYHLPSFGMGIGADKGFVNNVIENNTIYNNHDNGIRLNVFKNTSVKNNVLYNNERAQIYFDKDPADNNLVENNIMYSLTPEQLGLSLSKDGQGNQFDNNYYCNPYSEIVFSPSADLALWQRQHPQYEVHSRQCGEHFDYQITNTNTTDAVVTGTFDNDLAGWSGVSISHDPSKAGLDGGSLKVTFADAQKTILPERFPLVAGQLYWLKFSVMANDLGVIVVQVSDAPKGGTTQVLQRSTFATGPQRREHEMLFRAPLTTYNGLMVFIVNPSSSVADTVWLDNVSFEPIEAGNFNDATQRAQLFTNPTASPSTISLGAATYRNLEGQPVSGSLTLAPFTSQILVLNSGELPPVFDLLKLTINKIGNGTGTVTSNVGVGNGVNCGSICVESYNPGSQVTLTAAPDVGSIFVGWSGTGCANSFTINNSMTCTATFDLGTPPAVDHLLKMSVNGKGQVISKQPGIDCPDDCEEKYSNDVKEVTLLAIATVDSIFKNWSGDCSGTKPEIIVTLDADKSCTANFDSATHILTIKTQGDGLVTSNPEGINCGNICSKEYATGTVVKLIATPADSANSFSWAGDEDCHDGEVTLDADINCGVIFTTPQNRVLQIYKDGDGNGTVTGTNNLNCGTTCTQTYPSGSQVDLKTTPDLDSAFVGWTGEGCADSFTITNNINCTATFELTVFRPITDSYPLTVQLSGTGHGKVQSDPIIIDCDPQCTENYPVGTSVTLTALPAEDSTFVGWDGDCQTTEATTVVLMNEAKDCIAQFVPTQYTLTLLKQGSGTVISQPEGLICGDICTAIYQSGTLVTLQPKVDGNIRSVVFNGDPDCQDGQVTLNKDIQCEVVFGSLKPFVAPPCPLKDIINHLCNGEGKTVANLTIATEGNISNVKLADQIQNQGIVSNATIEPNATLTGGIVTGYITNQGTMQDFDFRGGNLRGGNLGGSITNTGTLEAVSLAAGTHIRGGKLAKTVTGDPKNKAVLENLEVQAGTQLTNVIIGNNVKLADAIIAVDIEFRADNLNNATLGGRIDNTGGGLITNAHLQANANLNGGNLSGDITGELEGYAFLDNLTIQTNAHLSYVKIGNHVQLPENVTLTDVEFQGEILQGATLSGTIKSGKQSILKDVHFKGNTHLIGGKVGGKIKGNSSQQLIKLEQLEILPGSELSQVLIGPNVVLPQDVVLTDRIQFTEIQAIPSELELSAILPPLRGQPSCVAQFSQPQAVDLTATLFPGGISILEAINEIPDVQARGWTISQNGQYGYLQVDQDNSQIALQPWFIKRNTVDKAQMQMTEQQTTMFITQTGLEILAQPAIQAPCELQAALEGVNLPAFVMQPNGNVIIAVSETAWYSARPDAATREITDPTTLGINFLPSKTAGTVIAQQVFTDYYGKQREQLFYPAVAVPEVLDKSADKITMELNGVVTFTLAGQSYHGVVDYAVTRDTVTTDNLKVSTLPDSNGDGQADLLVLYPTGEQQQILVIPAN
ncbi:MAG: right-handed parallel beta-helix repeat-containing protein, partial [Thioploca sp.]|nr:right-handed parallel beta-helix repeat-containing protein [Thioploca sp.]